jgi:hypothetical protein
MSSTTPHEVPPPRSLLDVLIRAGLIAVLVISCYRVLVPVYLVGPSLTESAEQAARGLTSGSYHVPPPPESIASWPVVGQPPKVPAWPASSSPSTPS